MSYSYKLRVSCDVRGCKRSTELGLGREPNAAVGTVIAAAGWGFFRPSSVVETILCPEHFAEHRASRGHK